MTTQLPVKSTLPFGSTATTVLSMRSVKVPCDPVTSRTIWSCPLPTKLTEVSTSVPESLIPPEADHVPVNGPTMTVLWMVTGTGVLAIAGVPAVPSDNSTDMRQAPMNDSRRMAPPFLPVPHGAGLPCIEPPSRGQGGTRSPGARGDSRFAERSGSAHFCGHRFLLSNRIPVQLCARPG